MIGGSGAAADKCRPPGDWRAWLFMGGRGAGKTRAGAEWVSARARYGHSGRIALIGPTFHDVREVMIEGASGLRSLADERPVYEASRKRLVWANGAQAYCFSAEDPESLRGPQFDAAWADELCFWAHPEETLATLEHGLRLGLKPRLMVTTTPRPIAALKRLLAARDTVVTRAATWDNRRNVAPDFIAALNERWSGTVRHRQELMGELIEDMEGALWTRGRIGGAAIAACRRRSIASSSPSIRPPALAPTPTRAASSPRARGARAWRARAVVLGRCSVQGAGARSNGRGAPPNSRVRLAPTRSSRRPIMAARWCARCCRRRRLNFSCAWCAPAKASARAPSRWRRSMRKAASRTRRRFPALEDEMCAFGADGFKRSPDRLDALVWALTDLLMGGAARRACGCSERKEHSCSIGCETPRSAGRGAKIVGLARAGPPGVVGARSGRVRARRLCAQRHRLSLRAPDRRSRRQRAAAESGPAITRWRGCWRGPIRSRPASNCWRAFYGHLQVAGNAFLEAASIDEDAPTEIYVLRPDRMSVIPGAGRLADRLGASRRRNRAPFRARPGDGRSADPASQIVPPGRRLVRALADGGGGLRHRHSQCRRRLEQSADRQCRAAVRRAGVHRRGRRGSIERRTIPRA